MRRQKKFKGIKLAPIVENARKIFVEKMISLGVVIVFLAVLLFLVKAFIHGSDYFRLKTVETQGLADQQQAAAVAGEMLRNHRDQHIFDINLKTAANYLKASCPDMRDVTVMRDLPDKLVVIFDERKPVAVLKDGRYLVDEDGYLLPNPGPAANGRLPVITGIDVGFWDKRGKKCESRNLKLALELIAQIKRTHLIAIDNVETIDASDINNMSFYMKNGVEVRIGGENFALRLKLLRRTLRDPRLVVANIRYIDVRFRDVIVSPK